MDAFHFMGSVHNEGMYSMTGFGRGVVVLGRYQATVEMSAVNRKQAEVVIQLPREIQELDSLIRKMVQQAVSRGRIQVSVHLEDVEQQVCVPQLDGALARAFQESIRELSEVIGVELNASVADYLKQPGILSFKTRDLEACEAWVSIEPAILLALEKLQEMRKTEGGHLKADLIRRMERIRGFAEEIALLAPERPVRQRELMTKRLMDAGVEFDLDDERLVRELAMFADRCDISEELTRLKSHFEKFADYVASSEASGRALDFLCQELFRELNTIGSKANDAGIAHVIVEAKTELEKIREQVQNVE